MSQYDNTNRGVLFINKDRASDNHPNARGSININGVEYWLSAWTKTSQAGEKFQSLSVTPKEAQAPVQKPVQQPAADMAFDDDVPF